MDEQRGKAKVVLLALLTALVSSVAPFDVSPAMSSLLERSHAGSLTADTAAGAPTEKAEEDEQARVRRVFDVLRGRLQAAWKWSFVMSIALFVMLIAMAVAAVVSGLVTGKSTYPVIFGGLSGVSLLTTIVWKPMDRVQQSTASLQRLEVTLLAVEQEWATCTTIDDPKERLACIRQANQVVLAAMEKLTKPPRS